MLEYSTLRLVSRLFLKGIHNDCIDIISARSALSDQSFKICEFVDDPYPLGERIRSAKMKTLLRTCPFNNLCPTHNGDNTSMASNSRVYRSNQMISTFFIFFLRHSFE